MELIARDLSTGPGDDLLCIDIRRDHVVKDALREGQKKKFCTQKHLNVGLYTYELSLHVNNYFYTTTTIKLCYVWL